MINYKLSLICCPTFAGKRNETLLNARSDVRLASVQGICELKKQQQELEEQTQQLIALKSLHLYTEEKLKNATEEIRLLKIKLLSLEEINSKKENTTKASQDASYQVQPSQPNHLNDLCTTIATMALANLANNMQKNDKPCQLDILQSSMVNLTNTVQQLADNVRSEFHHTQKSTYWKSQDRSFPRNRNYFEPQYKKQHEAGNDYHWRSTRDQRYGNQSEKIYRCDNSSYNQEMDVISQSTTIPLAPKCSEQNRRPEDGRYEYGSDGHTTKNITPDTTHVQRSNAIIDDDNNTLECKKEDVMLNSQKCALESQMKNHTVSDDRSLHMKEEKEACIMHNDNMTNIAKTSEPVDDNSNVKCNQDDSGDVENPATVFLGTQMSHKADYLQH